MTPDGRVRRLPAAPIWVQIVSLLIGSLMVAQLTPLVLALLMPPPPPPQYRLADIAAALQGGPLTSPRTPTLQRAYAERPPAPRSFGWVQAEWARRDLARLLHADPADVQLLFYSPPPFMRPHPRHHHLRRPGGMGEPRGMAEDAMFGSRPHGPEEGPEGNLGAGPGDHGPEGEEPGAPGPVASPRPPVPEAARPHPGVQNSSGAAVASTRTGEDGENTVGDLLATPPEPRPLFGLMRAANVDGEFVAALRLASGRWELVRPLHRTWLNPWQRRMALWFVLAFAITAPVGYLFARGLAAPLARLAETADRLGRDPSAAVSLTGGSAEIDRVARAFERMQARLRRYVDDRTAMVGAISHDLRTPLARMRFRLEKAPEALRLQMLGDIGQMEEMIAAVLAFIRDASEPGLRERVDLRSIVECVVDDAALVGGDASLAPGDPLPVEVDILSVQRLVTNLVENALKYGGRAQAALSREGDEAVVEIADDGPGLSDGELARVFEPFYRSGEGRNLNANGIGLGLSVARSIARAHGGDVILRRRSGASGLLAQVRLPLATVPAPNAGFIPARARSALQAGRARRTERLAS